MTAVSLAGLWRRLVARVAPLTPYRRAMERRRLERVAREVGCTKAQAVAIASRYFAAEGQRDGQ